MLQDKGNSLIVFLLSLLVGKKNKTEDEEKCLWKCNRCNAIIIVSDLKNNHCPACNKGLMIKYVEALK